MQKLINRDSIDAKYKWRLTDLVASDDDWEDLYSQISTRMQELIGYQGKLADESSLLECLDLESDLSEKFGRLIAYATMHYHTDESNTKYQAMTDRVERLAVKFGEITSFITPELTKFSTTRLSDIASKSEFVAYAPYLKKIIKDKRHILSEKEEKILSKVGSFSGGFENIFSMIDNVDIKWDKVKTPEGDMDMSHGRYSYFLQSPDRKVRKRAFTSMFGAYKDIINTISAVYSGSVKKDVFYAEARGYKSAMAKALSREDINPKVYTNLLSSIHGALKTLHSYVAYRKKALGYDKLHMYDMYVPICEGADIKLEYEDACDLVKKALGVMGEDYISVINTALTDGWVDVYENKGKRSGAYSWGVYGVHPYVLFNYTKTTHDVFTIAHELGHAMHSYYSSHAQPYACHDYEIFVAEIASTVNEVLLIKYLLASTEDKKLKKYLLSYFLDMFRTTIFRQTMFSEFEKFSHEKVEQGQPLTWEVMSDEYHRLNRQYYGKSVVSDDLIRYEWARIPHFYSAFYVYKYATGMICAVTIADRIFRGEEGALEKYKEFLSIGGSKTPLETLAVAGLDLVSTKEVFKTAMKVFEDTLIQLKSLDD
ncbi:MAG: oligoendopeptidase F [Clostridia bacterium]|nr:oligoendopeptidase F [Clostridia bacterium]